MQFRKRAILENASIESGNIDFSGYMPEDRVINIYQAVQCGTDLANSAEPSLLDDKCSSTGRFGSFIERINIAPRYLHLASNEHLNTHSTRKKDTVLSNRHDQRKKRPLLCFFVVAGAIIVLTLAAIAVGCICATRNCPEHYSRDVSADAVDAERQRSYANSPLCHQKSQLKNSVGDTTRYPMFNRETHCQMSGLHRCLLPVRSHQLRRRHCSRPICQQ
jgi:hypothetical protein